MFGPSTVSFEFSQLTVAVLIHVLGLGLIVVIGRVGRLLLPKLLKPFKPLNSGFGETSSTLTC